MRSPLDLWIANDRRSGGVDPPFLERVIVCFDKGSASGDSGFLLSSLNAIRSVIQTVCFSPTCGKTRDVQNRRYCRSLCVLLLGTSSAFTAPAQDAPKIRLIATGGTIAAGPSGSLTARDLRDLVPELAANTGLILEDYLAIGSSQMTPELQYGLAQRVNALFQDEPGLSGIVITHGTDSLEETAFLLDLLVKGDRPVVFTAAMRAPREPDSDAPRNLGNAVRLAASPAARGLGVVVTLNDEIYAARDVRKTHAHAIDAFALPYRGPLGSFDDGRIYITHKPAHRLTLDVADIEPRVSLIRLFSGSDGSLVRAAIESSQRGIVIEAFGRGNVPPLVMDAVREARARDVTVVFTTRTGGGRAVIGEKARRLGVLSGEGLDGLKARLVLVAALATTSDPATLQSYFRRLSGQLE
jgi:L-asparaginase